jgi:chaperonin GroEL|tara:strand:+ start:849 stop:2357 length:1509 start_codon:yes stop_codon:yes gene_type:complete
MIIHGKEVKEKLLEGINLVANTVKPTLGPQAKTVILQGNPPIIINDGVTITRHISSDDPYVQMGIQMVQNLASKAQEGSGDGTTTACILAQAFCNSIFEYFNVNYDYSTHFVNKAFNQFSEDVLKELDHFAEEIQDEDIIEVATIAANNDRYLGGLIADALSTVGRDGVVTVEESKSHETELTVREGMELTEGYISHLMVNTASGKTEFNNPLIFSSNLNFKSFKDIIPMLEMASTNGRPLIIFCGGMSGSALNNLIMNLMNQTVECCAILAPNFGDKQLDELADIRALVGGNIFTQESKDDPTNVTLSDFGTCESIVVTKENTTIVGGEGDTTEQIKKLRGQLEDMKGYEKARIKSRLARLSGGVATIRIGASSSMELRERKERLDDALNATKAALSEGIILGGGTTLGHVADSIETPFNFLKTALHEPYNVLLSNSNKKSNWLNDDLAGSLGFNALSGEYEDLIEAGVYDPVKVTKNSFLAALSIAQLFFSTDVAVLLEE